MTILTLTMIISASALYTQNKSHTISAMSASEYKALNPDTYRYYIPGDIMHIEDDNYVISFESHDSILTFPNKREMLYYIEETSARNSVVLGYKEDLDWNIQQGYIYSRTVYNEDESYMELIYDGPNWTINGSRDTTYLISHFNTVEKIYNPITKYFEYDAYSID